MNLKRDRCRKLQSFTLLVLASVAGTALPLMSQQPADTGTAAARGQTQARLLRFPHNRSLGQIHVQDASTREAVFWEAMTGHLLDVLNGPAWEPRGFAQSDVRVSPGQRVSLTIDSDAWQDLSPLTRLAPDDLYEISLAQTRVDDQALAPLAHLAGLQSLNLVGTAVTDRGLAEVARLQSLRWLALPEGITDEALAHLAGLPKLEGLLLPGKSLTGSGLVHLRRIPALRVLSLNGQSVLRDASLAPLAGLPRLESLSLGGASQVSDAGVDLLVSSPSLRTLDLFGTQVTPRGVARLTRIPSLEYLHLNTKPGLDDEALSALSRLPNLKRLRLGVSRTQHYTEKGLAELTKLERLELLHLSGPGVTDAALRQVAKLSTLRELLILNSPMSNTGLAAMASLKSLQVLDLRLSTRVTLGGLAVLNPLTNLRALYAMGGIEDDGARLDIGGLTNLTDFILEVSTKRLRADDLACFKSLTKLRSLQLGGNAVNDEALARLRGLTNLHRLRIGGPEVTDDGLPHFANLKQLEDLTLTGNISEVGLHRLEGLTALRALRIYSSQNLSSAAIQRFRHALPELRTFQADNDRNLAGKPQQLKAGDLAPSFTLSTLDGSEMRLSDLRGKKVLLYFWATWCTPCVASIPSLKEFHTQASRGGDFVMIGLSLDDSDDALRRFVQKHQLPWRQVRLGRQSRLAASYGIPDQAPEYVLVGPDGKVILAPPFDLQRVLDEIEKRDP